MGRGVGKCACVVAGDGEGIVTVGSRTVGEAAALGLGIGYTTCCKFLST